MRAMGLTLSLSNRDREIGKDLATISWQPRLLAYSSGEHRLDIGEPSNQYDMAYLRQEFVTIK